MRKKFKSMRKGGEKKRLVPAWGRALKEREYKTDTFKKRPDLNLQEGKRAESRIRSSKK